MEAKNIFLCIALNQLGLIFLRIASLISSISSFCSRIALQRRIVNLFQQRRLLPDPHPPNLSGQPSYWKELLLFFLLSVQRHKERLHSGYHLQSLFRNNGSCFGNDLTGGCIHHIICQREVFNPVFQRQLLIELITSNFRQVVTSRIKEHGVNQAPLHCPRQRFARTDFLYIIPEDHPDSYRRYPWRY